MRLIKVRDLIERGEVVFETFFGRPQDKRYAVLSHRWLDDETTFTDMARGLRNTDASYNKILGTAVAAQRDWIPLIWIDSVCINRESSSELSEAIQSMFRWYKCAEQCYVYLHDVGATHGAFAASEWFDRGWTLQELLAPRSVIFFDREWQGIGNKLTLQKEISAVTKIHESALSADGLGRFSVAQKMSWAARRITTRMEDEAYCLLGIFGVNMPLLYGEGENAFVRLQEEIIKDSDDQSIFAWEMSDAFGGMFALRASAFINCGRVERCRIGPLRSLYTMTNRGLSIEFDVIPWSMDTYLALIEAGERPITDDISLRIQPIGVFLRRLEDDDQYARVTQDGKSRYFSNQILRAPHRRQMRIRKYIDDSEMGTIVRHHGFRLSSNLSAPLRVITCSEEGSWDVSKNIASFPRGKFGIMLQVDFSKECRGLKGLWLGFNLEFDPICFLEDSSQDRQVANQVRNVPEVLDSEIPNAHGLTVYRDEAQSSSFWRLRGDRRSGLSVVLQQHGYDDEKVTLNIRHKFVHGHLIWEISIDRLDGVFANRVQKRFIQDWTSRTNFQTDIGLLCTDADLEKGDGLLNKAYNSFNIPRHPLVATSPPDIDDEEITL